MIDMALTKDYQLASKKVRLITDAEWTTVRTIVVEKRIIIVTDENLFNLYREELKSYHKIVLAAGEASKTLQTVEYMIEQLLEAEADKDCYLIGFGGGVITDITGYVASIYKRGMSFGYIPTSLMAMCDAALGGKNGVNFGKFKNVAGTINQPEFILFDYSLLKTLPADEWVNGIAEVIKHACIFDELLFEMLEKNNLYQLQSDLTLTAFIIEKSIALKMKVVAEDETDVGNRRKLNFGHTIGHALERMHDIPHGHAISIGMIAACALSEKITGLHFTEAARIVKLLAKYNLPVDIDTDHKYIFNAIRADKKRTNNTISFVLLDKIGKAIIRPVEMDYLKTYLKEIV